ncbi:MAG TPA: hypothetical protein VII25_14225, partial [Candidatus Acidoferrum sp.]
VSGSTTREYNMDKREAREKQISRLLEMDEDGLEKELVRAVSLDEALLASLNLPQTVPPQSAKEAYAAIKFSERIQRVKEALAGGLKKNKEQLYQLVCVKLKYCEQKGAGEIRLIGNILSGLMAKGVILVAYPKLWPIPAVIVYLHKNGFFDRLCKCPKKK